MMGPLNPGRGLSCRASSYPTLRRTSTAKVAVLRVDIPKSMLLTLWGNPEVRACPALVMLSMLLPFLWVVTPAASRGTCDLVPVVGNMLTTC